MHIQRLEEAGREHQCRTDAPIGETFKVVANVVGEQFEHTLARTVLRRESDGKLFIINSAAGLMPIDEEEVDD